jgi:hypothetical protein
MSSVRDRDGGAAVDHSAAGTPPSPATREPCGLAAEGDTAQPGRAPGGEQLGAGVGAPEVVEPWRRPTASGSA